MSVSVFSKNWYRVETIKPRLKVQVDISSQQHRNERWYILRDTISGNVQRYSWQAYQIIGLMDGEHSLNQIWESSGDKLEKEMPTQDEVISLVSSLYQNDMIHVNVPANARDLFHRKTTKGQKKLLQKAQSPLSLQIPLFDPTRLLDRLCPFLEKLIGWKLFIFYVVVVLSGCVLALQHFDALTSNMSDRILAAENLLLLWFLYPLIKIIHELGHAYAVRYYGGQVSEVGIMFLVFFPMPYVNATESATFENKYDRILVSAAGVIVELFIAAIALIFWSMVEEGFLKSILFNIVFMAGVSTLLFNGNPLLKFDAYYILSDFLEIPNLAKKSTSYWGYVFKRYLFGIRQLDNPAVDKREAWWLFFYNLFSFMYRIFISISIILFVGSKYFVLGVVLAIWSFFQGWLIPFIKTISKPFTENQFKMNGRNPVFMMGLAATFVWVVLFEIPLPHSVTSQGVVWLDEKNRLYAGESGFVQTVEAQSGVALEKSKTIIQLENFELIGRLKLIEAQLREAKARQQSVHNDRTKYLVVTEDINRLNSELKEVKDNISQAQVINSNKGTLVLAHAGEFQGRFLGRGELVGYVLTDDPLKVKVMLPESQAEQVVRNLQSVSMRPASDRSQLLDGQLITITPQVTQRIPSLVLSQQAGGSIIMNPSKSEEPTSVENYLELTVTSTNSLNKYVEERVFVKFSLTDEPIFWRVYRAVRRAFLEQFDV